MQKKKQKTYWVCAEEAGLAHGPLGGEESMRVSGACAKHTATPKPGIPREEEEVIM